MTRRFLFLAIILPFAHALAPKDELSTIHQPRSSGASSFKSTSSSLVLKADTTKRKFAYLDGFGTSGIKEIQDDSISSIGSNYRVKTKHKLSTFFTMVLFGTLFSHSIWSTQMGYRIAVAVAAIAYLIESACCSTRKYLSNMLTPIDVKNMLDNLRDMRPSLTWDLECYHYRSDYSRSKNVSHKESRTKFVTHRASQEYFYRECVDRTVLQGLLKALEYNPESNPFLKISVGKLLLFRNMETYQDYLNQLGSFVLREGNRDRYTDTSTSLQVPNFGSSKMLAIRTVIGVREHVRPVSFWLLTLLGLTVPYRVWLDRHCDNIDVVLTKEVG